MSKALELTLVALGWYRRTPKVCGRKPVPSRTAMVPSRVLSRPVMTEVGVGLLRKDAPASKIDYAGGISYEDFP